jgi:hypothetical protein
MLLPRSNAQYQCLSRRLRRDTNSRAPYPAKRPTSNTTINSWISIESMSRNTGRILLASNFPTMSLG